MSNAKLFFEEDKYSRGPFFKLSVSEFVEKNGLEYEEIRIYFANNKQIIKNNNIIVVTRWLNNGYEQKKMLIKSIDRITILDGYKSLHVELTVEILE